MDPVSDLTLQVSKDPIIECYKLGVQSGHRPDLTLQVSEDPFISCYTQYRDPENTW